MAGAGAAVGGAVGRGWGGWGSQVGWVGGVGEQVGRGATGRWHGGGRRGGRSDGVGLGWRGGERGSCGTASACERPARSRRHAVSCIDDARPCLAFPRGINLSHSPSGPPLKRRRPCITRGYASRPRGNRRRARYGTPRSEEHTSELQSLMRYSYAVFCLKK